MTAENYLESEGINKDALFDYDELVKLLKSYKGYKPKKGLQERKDMFSNKLEKFRGEFIDVILFDFYEYWTEHGESDRKMRFEKQTSFNIKLRLARWKRNSNGFDKPKKESAAIILQRKHGLI